MAKGRPATETGSLLLEREQYVPLRTATKVIISFKQVWNDPGIEQEVNWPAGWRLPQQGESVTVDKDTRGLVSTVDFDLDRNTAIIVLR
jgi:hypothetical protein